MSSINNKTAARIAAVQALYQLEIDKDKNDINKVLENLINSYEEKDFKLMYEIPNNLNIKLHKKHLAKLALTTVENIEFIDDTIDKYLSQDWKFSNLHLSLLSLLRVAIAEIVYLHDTPYKVAINEFTNIGNGFLQDFEISFVNSILDKISKQFRKEDGTQFQR